MNQKLFHFKFMILILIALAFAGAVTGDVQESQPAYNDYRFESGDQREEAFAFKHYIEDLERQHGRRELWALEPNSVDINVFLDIDSHMVNRFQNDYCPMAGSTGEMHAIIDIEETREISVNPSAWGGSNPVSGMAKFAEPLEACDPITNDLTGKIAIVKRGSCSFDTKAVNAELAGAVAVLVLNNGGTDASMGCSNGCDHISVPAIFVPEEEVPHAEFAAKYNFDLSIDCQSDEVLVPNYGYGATGATDCEGDLTMVMSLQECEFAAQKMDANWAGSVTWTTAPSGCIADNFQNGGNIWFNTHLDGPGLTARRPVCRTQSGCASGPSNLKVSYNFAVTRVVETVPTTSAWAGNELVSPLVATRTDPLDACSAVANDLTGKIAVINRGGCSFSQKVINAQNSGASAVIILNNGGSDLSAMSCAGSDCDTVDITAVFINNDDVGRIELAVDYGFPLEFKCPSGKDGLYPRNLNSCDKSEFVVMFDFTGPQALPTQGTSLWGDEIAQQTPWGSLSKWASDPQMPPRVENL